MDVVSGRLVLPRFAGDRGSAIPVRASLCRRCLQVPANLRWSRHTPPAGDSRNRGRVARLARLMHFLRARATKPRVVQLPQGAEATTKSEAKAGHVSPVSCTVAGPESAPASVVTGYWRHFQGTPREHRAG